MVPIHLERALNDLRIDWPKFNSIPLIDKANRLMWDALKLIDQQLEEEEEE